jgi:hypothetical protein
VGSRPTPQLALKSLTLSMLSSSCDLDVGIFWLPELSETEKLWSKYVRQNAQYSRKEQVRNYNFRTRRKVSTILLRSKPAVKLLILLGEPVRWILSNRTSEQFETAKKIFIKSNGILRIMWRSMFSFITSFESCGLFHLLQNLQLSCLH